MANMRQVNTFFWDDSYIEELNPNGKLLFIYLITSPLTNIAGSFEISLKKICDHTGLSRSKVEEILAKFEQDGKFFYKDHWMFAVNGIEHQANNNEKIQKGIETIISTSPGWVIDRVCIAYSWLAHLKNSLSHLKEGDSKEDNSKEEKEEGAASPDPPAKPIDARRVHPAIVGTQEVTGKCPPKELWDELIDRLGDDIDKIKLKQCWIKWRAKGFKPTNYAWALEWYIDGIPDLGKDNGTNRQNNTGHRATTADRLRGQQSILAKYESETEG